MASTIAIIGIAISAFALAIAGATAIFAHRQLNLTERQRQRDFEATVVVELIGVTGREHVLDYEILVTNAGPAVARDVSVAILEWSNNPFGRQLVEAEVAPALLRGEQRTVALELPIEQARFDDRTVSIELVAEYYDDNGVRSERLALVFSDGLVLTPPQPPATSK